LPMSLALPEPDLDELSPAPAPAVDAAIPDLLDPESVMLSIPPSAVELDEEEEASSAPAPDPASVPDPAEARAAAFDLLAARIRCLRR